MSLLNTIFSLVFPSFCLSCGKKGVDFCLECLVGSPQAERECAKWIHPLYEYRHPPIKKSVWLLKYKGKRPLAGIFGEVMYGRILEELADLSVMENFTSPLLIPIPLSKSRERERGFNQAELICRKLTELNAGKNFQLEKNVLIKPKDGEHQARIENRTERIKNIVGSFAVINPEKIYDRNIILIDDVTTTGATLSEAKKVLREAGARKIVAFTIAH
jgi:competence protein ComFC